MKLHVRTQNGLLSNMNVKKKKNNDNNTYKKSSLP